jgi:hypothetical protein
MHKAFGFFARSSRSVKTQILSPARPVLKLVTPEQEEQEFNRDQETKEENSKQNYLLKGVLFGLVMFVGQKIDDTVANMFFWGSGLEVKWV